MNNYEHLGSKKYYFIRVNQIYQYLRNCVKTSARRFPLWKTPQPSFWRQVYISYDFPHWEFYHHEHVGKKCLKFLGLIYSNRVYWGLSLYFFFSLLRQISAAGWVALIVLWNASGRWWNLERFCMSLLLSLYGLKCTEKACFAPTKQAIMSPSSRNAALSLSKFSHRKSDCCLIVYIFS